MSRYGITYPFADTEFLFTYKQFYFGFMKPEERQLYQLVEDDPDMMKMKIRRLAPGELGKSPWHSPEDAGPTHQHYAERATP